MLFLMQSRILLAFWAASSHCWIILSFSSSAPPSPSRGCSQSILHPACICGWDCTNPGARLRRWTYWTSWSSHRPTSPACQGPCGWHPFPLACWSHHTAWCHWQTFWQCIQSHCRCCWRRCWTTPVPALRSHWSPPGHWVVDRKSLSMTILPVPYLPSGLSIQSMSLQFRDKDVVRDSVKCFAQVQVDDDSYSSLIHQCCNPIIEGHHIFQARLSLLAVVGLD